MRNHKFHWLSAFAIMAASVVAKNKCNGYGIAMFRLAHLSDIHLSPLPPVQFQQLISKRITGYLNWKLNRTAVLQDGILEGLVDHMKAAHPHHIAVAGDLVNLALQKEFDNARAWLDELGEPEDVSVVPGNHDGYVPGAIRTAVRKWGPYMAGDQSDGRTPFPYRRDRGPIALIGVNSGCSTPPFFATGRFGYRQARKTKTYLDEAKTEGKFRVVMIHHPPFVGATAWMKRLVGQNRFRKMISQTGAELILHGHTHIDSLQWIYGPDGPVPVVGVPSASAAPSQILNPLHFKPAARYNLFSVDGETGRWNCKMEEFGYSSEQEGVNLIATHTLIKNGTVLQQNQD